MRLEDALPERLLLRLGISQSDDTILRLLKREAARRTFPVLHVVGIDDWSWQRGRSYRTIVVDLERRRWWRCWRTVQPKRLHDGFSSILKLRWSAGTDVVSTRRLPAVVRRR
jgi:hypothetical protein